MNVRSLVAMLLACAVPGAGHFYLGRRARAAAFFAIIVFLFSFGLFVGGDLYTLDESRKELIRILATYGSMGSGALYFIGQRLDAHGNITESAFEYGRMFTLSAGLMNLLLMLDCYDIAMGRKKW